MLQSSGRPERILVCGRNGSGKTKSYWDIAEWLDRTESPAQMFVIDPDYKARLDPRYPLPNVHVFDDLEEWQDYKKAAIQVKKLGEKGRGDWCVVDMMSTVWTAAQSGHAELTLGKEFDELMIAWRKKSLDDEKAGGSPFSSAYGADWQVINALYGVFIFNVTRFPGNVFLTSALDSITEDEKDKEILRKYSKWGVKPAGQKRLGHVPADEILLREEANGWSMTQMRGTGREPFKNEPLSDFCMDYLVKHGGWTL